jgi:16S rRNA (uracil1498-N3)-methyltransferase
MRVVDGEGGWYRLRVQHADDGQVVGHIVERRREVGEPPVDVTVGLGLLKKRQRFETFAEKAVELGARRIVPLRTTHTETDSFRHDRVRNVMVAALKQCRRSRLPTLAPPRPMHEVLVEAGADQQFICHGTADRTLREGLREGGASPDSVLVLVGPEGGFHASEVEAATDAGCTAVALGSRRLRAETAGMVSVSAVVHEHGAGRGDDV